MLKAIGMVLICLAPFFVSSASDSGFQVGTITAVAVHQGPVGSDSSITSYDVSVRVGNTVFVVLYTPPLGTDTVRYVAGRDLLVLVGEKTLTFNDDLGRSQEVSILNRASATTKTSPNVAVQQPLLPTASVELLGLPDVKDNTKGSLIVAGGKLHFAYSYGAFDLAATSVEDVVTGRDSQRVIRGTLGTLSMFGPYGSGRVLSLFRTKLDTLTIQYRDGDGGLHGVVFTLPVGGAEPFKSELVAQGAHTSIPSEVQPVNDSSNPVAMEKKP